MSRLRRAQRLETLEQRIVLDSTVVFNEIMYNPIDSDTGGEWVELHNQMSVEMDISNWSLAGGVDFTFPEGTRIAGDRYLVIASDPENIVGDNVLGPFLGSLSNAGEDLLLINNSGRLMNRVDYGDNGDWPVGPDGGGVNLAKSNRNGPSDDPANWTISAQVGGTPGNHNFPVAGEELGPVLQTLVGPGTHSRVFIPTHASQLQFEGHTWNEPAFDDQTAPGWFERSLGVGFDTTGESEIGPLIDANGDIEAQMHGINASALVRSEFNISDPDAYSKMLFSVNHDDGFVAYLNGVEVARNNVAPGTPAFDATAKDESSGGGTADPSLLLQFRADDPNIVTEGDIVTVWPDLAGTPQDAIPFGVGPIKTTTTINGNFKDAIRFNGLQALEVAQTVPVAEGTVVVVVGSNGGGRIIGWEDSAAGNGGLGLSPNISNRLYAIMRGPDGANLDLTNNPPNQDVEIVTLTWGPGGRTMHRNDGSNSTSTQVASASGNSAINDLGYNLLIGGPGDQIPAAFFSGDILELQVYNQQLTNSTSVTREDVEADLYNRWFNPSSAFNITAGLNLLQAGTNVLAIQGLNVSPGDSDFLVQPNLEVLPKPVEPNPFSNVSFDRTRVLVPTQAGDLQAGGLDWNDPDFNDQASPGWFDRTLGIGFDTTGISDVRPMIDTNGDIQTKMFNVNPAAFVRSEFTITDPDALDRLRMTIDADDGYVAYLNGNEVARFRAPDGVPAFDAAANIDFTAAPSELVLNFRADDPTMTLDGNTVTNWPDVAGTPEDAVSTAGFASPTKTTVTINGIVKDAIHFDTTNQMLEANHPVPTEQGTFFIVMNSEGGTSNPRVIGWEDNTAGQGGLGLSSGLGGRLWAIIRSGSDVNASPPVESDFETVTVTWGPDGRKLYRNHGTDTSELVAQNASSGAINDLGFPLHIGGPGDASLSNSQAFFNGNILEIRVYNEQLSDTTEIMRSSVETELYNRWFTSGGGGGGGGGGDELPDFPPVHQEWDLVGHLEALVPGTNVLAIQGLNSGIDDEDFLIDTKISVREAPVKQSTPARAVINEVPSAMEDPFWLEISNLGGQELNLDRYVLKATGASGGQYTFPAITVAPGEFLTVTESQLGFDATDGEKLFLYQPGENELADAREVTGRLRGRSPQHNGRWLYPDVTTPGTANSFQFHDEIVINEILYQHQPELGTNDIPGTFSMETILPMDAVWRFNDTGIDLGPTWYQQAHVVDTFIWKQGTALIGNDPTLGGDVLPEPGINTLLAEPQFNNPFVQTYYYETDIEITNLDNIGAIQLQHVIDDGAVFYLNGVEVHRYNMNGNVGDPVLATDPSSDSIGNAAVVGTITIPKTAFVEGTNLFSVEVHQRGSESSDTVFGAELFSRKQLTGSIPGKPYHEIGEEWLELFNRSSTTVDLTGWTLRDGIDFDFPAGTMIEPGEYVVVANDAAALATEFPEITVVGEYRRSLSNKSDRVLLRDPNDNPADEVRYFDGGRWPAAANGGGSSLELRNPDADNSIPESWSASDESIQSEWQTYTLREIAQVDTGPVRWNDFIFGMLDAGEVLIDDVSVVANPGGAATELIQNGEFDSDSLGQSPSKWRIMGTHQGTVVVDPNDAANQVLHLVASRQTDENHNKAETTFANNTRVVNGTEYEISFRAKWLSGSRQLNTRFYVARVANTFILDAPFDNGTPGAVNTTFEANIGPTYTQFKHLPIIPDINEPVVISVQAEDPNGVSSMLLWWKTATGSFNSAPMLAQGNVYTATIPGQTASKVVQFYVEGTDSLGTTSTYPPAGPDSRALYIVDDGQTSSEKLRSFRLIMFPTEGHDLFQGINLASNAFAPATVVDNESEVFYDVGVHLHGSPAGRTVADRRSSYTIGFDADQLFRGVHSSVILDTSGASGVMSGSQDEILATHLLNHAGGGVSLYNDLVHQIVPNNLRNGPAILIMARYTNLFLDEHFGDNNGGTVYDFNKITGLSQTHNGTDEGLKLNTSWSYHDTDFQNLGDDKEIYRWNITPKNNRNQDNFDEIIAMSKAFSLSGSALDAASRATMDIDSWLRTFAFQSLVGNLDVYTVLTDHNMRLYVRPDNHQVMALPWDLDHSWRNSTSAALHGLDPSNLTKIINLPHNLRQFYGHLQDMINTTFNSSYVTHWAQSLGQTAGQNYSGHVTYVTQRSNFVTNELTRLAPPVDFVITNAAPLNVGTASTVTINGWGWINVREIRLAGSSQALDTTWTVDDGAIYADTWSATIPVTSGTNPYTLEAYDFQGDLIGSSTIQVTSSTPNPVADSLRITEINYNPSEPTAAELVLNPLLDNDAFEFLEVQNIGSQTINLLGTSFTDGIQFAFPDTELTAGQRGVVVRDLEAFGLRYGTGMNVLGEFTNGALANGGENLTLLDGQLQTVLDFSYNDNDPWPERADGAGGTIEIIDASTTPTAEYGKHYRWRGSTAFGGSPNAAGSNAAGIVINEILAHTDPPVTELDSIELYNPTMSSIDMSGWWLSDSDANLLKFQIPGGTTLDSGEYLVFNADDFNPTPLLPRPNDFGLSGANGDQVWLVISDGNGEVKSFVDDIHFGATPNGESFGRVPNGSGLLAPLESLTLGTENSAVRVGPLSVTEVNYNPGSPSLTALAIEPNLVANDLEFVELHNPTGSTVNLTNWRIAGGIDFEFAAGTTIAAEEVAVVVPFDPNSVANTSRLEAFREHYGIDTSVRLLGGFANQLSDSDDRVELQRPDSPPVDNPTVIPNLQEESMLYDDLAPWPISADGTGHSLHRTLPARWASDVVSWTSGNAAPGTLIRMGDLDLDGDVDTGDLTQAIINFTSAGGSGKTWQQGDFDGDGDVDTGDLTSAIINFTGALTSRGSTLGSALLVTGSVDEGPTTAKVSPAEKPQPVNDDRSTSRSQSNGVLTRSIETGIHLGWAGSGTRPANQLDVLFEMLGQK